MSNITPKGVIERYRQAKERRGVCESHWQEFYDYALPQRAGIIRQGQPGEKKPINYSTALRLMVLVSLLPACCPN